MVALIIQKAKPEVYGVTVRKLTLRVLARILYMVCSYRKQAAAREVSLHLNYECKKELFLKMIECTFCMIA